MPIGTDLPRRWENQDWAHGHAQPGSTAALSVLRSPRENFDAEPGNPIFANRSGRALSDAALTKVMRDADVPYDAHGFRSTFRDWAAEAMPEIPTPVAEAAFAHSVPDKTVRAYKRTTFIEMRRKLLDAWGNFVIGAP